MNDVETRSGSGVLVRSAAKQATAAAQAAFTTALHEESAPDRSSGR